MKDYIGKYIGPNKIQEITLSTHRTFKDKNVYCIKYKDDVVQCFPEEVIKQIATKNSCDFTELRDLRVFPAVEKMLEVIAESDLKIEDINYCFDKTKHSIEDSQNKAHKVLWGKEQFAQTVMDIHRVLMKKDE